MFDVDIFVEMVSFAFSQVVATYSMSVMKMLNCTARLFGEKMRRDHLLFPVDHHGWPLSSLRYSRAEMLTLCCCTVD